MEVQPREFFHKLHAFRGILALWVIFYHMNSDTYQILNYIPFRSNGYLSVDAFFILSGFMLAYTYKSKFSRNV